MTRKLIAQILTAILDKVKHVHKWKKIRTVDYYSNGIGEGELPNRSLMVYQCDGCGKHKKIKI